MAQRSKQLQALQPVLQAAFDAEQQKMRALGEEINALIALRDGLEAPSGPEDFALRSTGADMRWLAWSQARKEKINAQLSQLLARRERLRSDLKTAFGRREAGKKMLELQKKAEQRKKSDLS